MKNEKPIKLISPTVILEIKKLHGEINAIGSTAIQKAIRIGELLVGVKEDRPHGDFIEWVEKQKMFTRQTAANYMRIFEHRNDPNVKRVLHLKDALQLLSSGPRKSSPPPVPPPRKRHEPDQPPQGSGNVNNDAPSGDGEAETGENGPPNEPNEAPKPTPPPPKPVFRDETGYPIPEKLLPEWAKRDCVSTSINQLQATLRLVESLENARSDIKQLGWVNFQEVTIPIRNAIKELKLGRAYAVCGHCQGRGDSCGNCKGVGLVNKFFWDHCVPQEIKDIRKNQYGDPK